MFWGRLTVRRKIIALASGLVLLSLLVGSILVVFSVSAAVETELGKQVMAVARTVAEVDSVKQELELPTGSDRIQSEAERIRLSTGVDYIVILDMDLTRHSHPLDDRVGTKFQDSDVGPALAEQAYISHAWGVNGQAVRAFVPIMSMDEREQVGVAVVGALVPGVWTLLSDYQWYLLTALIAALIVGIVGAYLLGSSIRRQMFDMEPTEIARVLEERTAAFGAISEGLIAVDSKSHVTVMNGEAKRILGLPAEADVVGRDIRDIVPYSRLPELVATGQGIRNEQMLFGTTIILTNRFPIYVKGRIVGALATFRDRTELHQLAEELTGVTQFVDALRAQNHEWLNKLHTIAGLIQMKKYNQAMDYIFSTAEQQQELARFLARAIKEHRVSGLLLGKVIRARERGIDLVIDRQTRLDALPSHLKVSDLVVVLGNLLENSMDAVAENPDGQRRISCLLRGSPEGLSIRVEDNGRGLPPDVPPEQIFEQGFSTKGSANRGIGLALVKQIVDFAQGSVQVESQPGRTVFEIVLPGGVAGDADQGARG